MFHINNQQKDITRTTFLTIQALVLYTGSTLVSPGAHASPLPVFPVASQKIAPLPNTDQAGPSATRPEKQAPRYGFTTQNVKITARAIQIALTRVADGGAYKWQHKWSKLQGKVSPTTTYRNTTGQLCRHIVYSINRGNYRKKSEAIACRNSSGRWALKS